MDRALTIALVVLLHLTLLSVSTNSFVQAGIFGSTAARLSYDRVSVRSKPSSIGGAEMIVEGWNLAAGVIGETGDILKDGISVTKKYPPWLLTVFPCSISPPPALLVSFFKKNTRQLCRQVLIPNCLPLLFYRASSSIWAMPVNLASMTTQLYPRQSSMIYPALLSFDEGAQQTTMPVRFGQRFSTPKPTTRSEL